MTKFEKPMSIQPNRKISTNAIWNFGGYVLQAVVAILCIPFLIKYLGLSRVGLLSLIWVLVGYFSIFDFGIMQALTKTVSEALAAGDSERATRLYRTATQIQVVMGLIGGLMIAVAAPYLVSHVLSVPADLQTEALTSVYLCAIAFPFVLLASSPTAMLQAAQRFDLINLVQVPLGIAQFLLPLVCAIWSSNLAVVVGVLLLSRIVATVLFLRIVRSVVQLCYGDKNFSRSDFRVLISFGGWVTVSNVVSPLMVYADRFLVGALQTVTAMAYYAVPSDAVMRFLVVPRSLVSALFPVLSVTRDLDRISDLCLRSVRYILLLVGIPSVFLFVFSHEVMSLWIGETFALNSAVVLQILLIGIVANCVAQVPYALIQASGRADITARLHLYEFPFYVVIAYCLIKEWGIQGAALAWTLRLITESMMLFIIARRKARFTIGTALQQFIPQILATFVLLGTAADVARRMFVGERNLLLTGLGFSLALAIISWVFFLTKTERFRLKQSLLSSFGKFTVKKANTR